jgi:hypothetical protein
VLRRFLHWNVLGLVHFLILSAENNNSIEQFVLMECFCIVLISYITEGYLALCTYVCRLSRRGKIQMKSCDPFIFHHLERD